MITGNVKNETPKKLTISELTTHVNSCEKAKVYATFRVRHPVVKITCHREDADNRELEIIITPAMKKKLDFSCDEIPRKKSKVQIE